MYLLFSVDLCATSNLTLISALIHSALELLCRRIVNSAASMAGFKGCGLGEECKKRSGGSHSPNDAHQVGASRGAQHSSNADAAVNQDGRAPVVLV
jgi:hypothetical protein